MRVHEVLLTVVLVVGRPDYTSAVCLNGHPSVEQEYRQSSVVFVGRVTAATAVLETKSFYDGTRYTIQVKETFRGRPRHILTVFSENSTGRFPMEVGADYLLFLSFKAGEPAMVDNCGNSGPVAEVGAAIEAVKQMSRHPQ